MRVFVLGELPRGPCVGVVGTRDPTPAARDYARQLAFDLAQRGIAVVSGGAAGIDAAAHEGALAAGGATLVVAPSSFDLPYPEEHADLFARIVASGGAHLSPFENGVVARRHHFFLRNSWLVALSHAVVLVEAPLRSGARNAARWARELQRPCFVVPSVPWNPRGLGCIAELERGARPIASVEPILRWLEERQLHGVPPAGGASPGWVLPLSHAEAAAPRPTRRSRRLPSELDLAPDSLEGAILGAVDAGARHPAEIAAQLAQNIGAVSHAVLLLTLSGVLARGDDGAITRAR